MIQIRSGRTLDRLPRLDAMSPPTREINTNIPTAKPAHWAAIGGMSHLKIADDKDFDALQPCDRPFVAELVPDETRIPKFP